MSVSYTKLFSSIVTSSVWVEDDATLRVWIAMLATADITGRVDGSIPGFANLARVTVEQMRAAIEKFSAPDPDSRTKDHEGRRIKSVDGGWILLTYEKHREDRDGDERRAQVRAAVARHRARNQSGNPGNQNTDYSKHGKPRKAKAEASADAVVLPSEEPAPAPKPRKIRQPHAWTRCAAFTAITDTWPAKKRLASMEAAFAAWEGLGDEGKARVAAEVARELAETGRQFLPQLGPFLVEAARTAHLPLAAGAAAPGKLSDQGRALLAASLGVARPPAITKGGA